MKTLMYLPVLLLLLCSFSCDNGRRDDGGANLLGGSGESALEGSWYVSNVSGGFAGIDDDMEEGLITWEFDSGTMRVHIVNNETSESLYDGFQTGSYGYTILELGGNAYLFIEGQEYAHIGLSAGKLVLDGNRRSGGSGADLFILTLLR